MNKEWAWLTNEQAHLLKWEDALRALSGKATTQNNLERADMQSPPKHCELRSSDITYAKQ
jgi:hypothetical protein